MKNTLLVQTLMAFTAAERREIGLFLQGDFTNRGKHAKQLERLFNLLMLHLKHQKLEDLSKTQLFAEFFPDGKHTAGYFDNLMTELLGLFRQFMCMQWVRQEEIMDIVSARFYQQRGLEIRAAQTLNRLIGRLQKRPELDAFRLLLQLWAQLETLAMESRHNQRQGDLNLPASLRTLTLAFSSQLFHLSTLLYQQQRYAGQPDRQWNNFIEAFRQLAQQESFFGEPSLALMHRSLQLITQNSAAPRQDLEALILLLRQYEASFPEEMIKNLASCARNFCSAHYRTDPAGMGNIMLQLYQDHLQKGWLYENGLLHASYFINMVTMGLRARQARWVLELLMAHRKKVINDEAENIWQYGMANYHFYMGNLAEANKFVLTHKPGDFEIEKVMRIFNVKIAWELDPQGLNLKSQLQAFSMSLSRNKSRLAKEKQIPARRFIAAMRKLIQWTSARSSHRASVSTAQVQLKSYLQMVKDPLFSVAEKEWLLEKLEQARRV